MRSEEEIRKAIRHFIALDEKFIADFIEEDCCVEQLQTLEAAIEELLALRAMAKRILEAWDKGFAGNHDAADAIIKYLTEE